MGDMSNENCSLENHTISQQYRDSNHGILSSVYGFLNSHTLSQCEHSSVFHNIDDDVKKGDCDVSSGYGFQNIHTLFQR